MITYVLNYTKVVLILNVKEKIRPGHFFEKNRAIDPEI